MAQVVVGALRVVVVVCGFRRTEDEPIDCYCSSHTGIRKQTGANPNPSKELFSQSV